MSSFDEYVMSLFPECPFCGVENTVRITKADISLSNEVFVECPNCCQEYLCPLNDEIPESPGGVVKIQDEEKI